MPKYNCIVKSISTAVCWVMIGVCVSAAQETTVTNESGNVGCWASVGIGGSRFGPTFGANLCVTWRGNIFSARFMMADEFVFGAGDLRYDEPLLRMRQIGVLYGREYRKKTLVLSLLAGLSYLDGVDRGNLLTYHLYETKSLSGIGVPIEARARIELLRRFGIELLGFGILSNKAIIWGWMVELCIALEFMG